MQIPFFTNQMNKTAYIIIAVALVFGIGLIITSVPKTQNVSRQTQQVTQEIQNSEIKDGIQYITINAGGGYTPRISTAKAGIPTKLIVKTNGAYDCSSSLAIPSISYRKILPQTGETEIDIGTPKAGIPLQGICGMGMYNFNVNFN